MCLQASMSVSPQTEQELTHWDSFLSSSIWLHLTSSPLSHLSAMSELFMQSVNPFINPPGNPDRNCYQTRGFGSLLEFTHLSKKLAEGLRSL